MLSSAHPLVLDAVLMGALVHAVWTDLRWRRIYNRMTYPVIAAGLVAHGLLGGASGLALSGTGVILAVALLAIPCAFRVMGLGDLKLLAAIGALQGPEFVTSTLLYGALAGGVLAIGFVVYRRVLGRDAGTADASAPLTMPYGPAIAAGAALVLASRLAG